MSRFSLSFPSHLSHFTRAIGPFALGNNLRSKNTMRSGKKKLIWITLAVLLILGGGAWGVYQAAQHVPQFYASALDQSGEAARNASGQMRRHFTSLATDTQRTGRWSETITADQINGWLAVDLVEKHPGTLPDGVRDPRVSITAEEARIGCQVDDPWPNMVYSIAVEPYVAEPNVIAVRFRGARAGALPMPLGDIINEIAAGAAERGMRLRWQQQDGDPVLLLPLEEAGDAERYVLQAIELTDGAIRLSGRTMSKQEARAAQESSTTAKVDDQSADQDKAQR